MKKLEGELQRLIAAVDARLEAAPEGRPPAPRGWTGRIWPQASEPGQRFALAGIGMLLVTLGWAGSSLYYSTRLSDRIEDVMRPYATELADTVTTIQADLVPRMAIADDLKTEIDRARRDLLERDREMETTLTAAQSQLLSVRDAAIDDIERRLTDQTDDLSTMLEMLRQRAVELDQGLDDITATLGAFDAQLPVLTDGFGEVAAQLVESRTMLERVAADVAALDGKAPPLLATLDKHQTLLDEESNRLAALRTRLESLENDTAESNRQLEQALEQGREQIAGWTDIDRQVAARKDDIMHNLDRYADSLNSHVREFLEVLNSQATFTGG